MRAKTIPWYFPSLPLKVRGASCVSNRLVASILLCLVCCTNRLRAALPENAASRASLSIDWRHSRKYVIFHDLEYFNTRRRASSHHFRLGNFGKYFTAKDSNELQCSTSLICSRTSRSPWESAATAASPAGREKRMPFLYWSINSLRSGLNSAFCWAAIDILNLHTLLFLRDTTAPLVGAGARVGSVAIRTGEYRIPLAESSSLFLLSSGALSPEMVRGSPGELFYP